MLEPGDILNRDGTNLALWVSLSGMPPDAVLEIVLPVDYAWGYSEQGGFCRSFGSWAGILVCEASLARTTDGFAL